MEISVSAIVAIVFVSMVIISIIVDVISIRKFRDNLQPGQFVNFYDDNDRKHGGEVCTVRTNFVTIKTHEDTFIVKKKNIWPL